MVEGRADVVNLLKNRINNVIGMNGTKLPAEIAKLGEKKEITLFVDGDRGGKLIAKNVIGNAKIAYVAMAPDGKEVEELTGKEIIMSLRKRVPVREFLGRIGDVKEESEKVEAVYNGDVKEGLRKAYGKIKGTKQALLLDASLDVIRAVSSKEVSRSVRMSKNDVFAVVIDGSALRAIIEACEEKGVKYLAATQFTKVGDTKVNLISL